MQRQLLYFWYLAPDPGARTPGCTAHLLLTPGPPCASRVAEDPASVDFLESLSRYQQIRYLSRGLFGHVVQALDKETGETVRTQGHGATLPLSLHALDTWLVACRWQSSSSSEALTRSPAT